MSDHELAVTGLVLGLVGIVAGILTSYYFYLKARERVDPRYVLQHRPLVDSSSGAMTEVAVLFKGSKVTNLNRCILAIWNRGTRVITRDAIAENDKVRVCLPEGATALGIGVAWSSRPAIGLSAQISDAGSTVTINFDFLDQDDGGLVEILYQGDSKAAPTLTGSIMGAPKGIRSIPGTLEFDGYEDEDEDEGGRWKRWIVLAVALCISAAISAEILGPSSTLSIVLYTLITELILVALFFASISVFLQHAIDLPEFWKYIPRSGGDKAEEHH